MAMGMGFTNLYRSAIWLAVQIVVLNYSKMLDIQ